jgi:MFS transporter, DHA2 family, multidrug resistance protein
LGAQTAETSSSDSPKATRRDWIGLAVIALPCLVVTMDLDVLYLAVPKLSADLAPTSSQLLWITDIYGFLIAGSLLTMGTLGDRIGRRKLLLIGAMAFGLASLFAAFSRTAEMLIAARALLGVAGATLAPSTLSLISNMFQNRQQRTVAIGIWAASFSAGSAIGPMLGGVLLEYFWWGSVFLLAVPVMVLLLALGPSLLPEFRDPRSGRIDLISAAQSLAAILLVIYGLKQIAEEGAGPVAVSSMVAGVVVGLIFVRRQRSLEDPLISMRMFRASAFSVSLGVNVLAMFALLGAYLFVAQYLQLVLGLSPLRAGLWTVPSSLGLIFGSMLAPVVVRWVNPAFAMAAGLVASAIGFLLLTQVEVGSGLPLLVAGSVIFSLGVAPTVTLSTDMIVGTAPPERAGAASGISETGTELGGALGIAILGSIGTAVYRTNVADSIPSELPPGAESAATDTLGGALAIAQRLSEPVAAEMIEAARAAFTGGLRMAAVISAGVAATIAVLAATLLRDARPREPAADRAADVG